MILAARVTMTDKNNRFDQVRPISRSKTRAHPPWFLPIYMTETTRPPVMQAPIACFLTALILAAATIDCAAATSAVVVEKASLRAYPAVEAKDTASQMQLLLDGHKLDRGEKFVVAIRRFEQEKKGSVDSGPFSMISFEVPELPRTKASIPLQGVRFFYSSSSAGWASRGLGLYASSASGTAVLTRTSTFLWRSTFDLALDATVTVTSASPGMKFTGETREIRLRQVLKLQTLKEYTQEAPDALR